MHKIIAAVLWLVAFAGAAQAQMVANVVPPGDCIHDDTAAVQAAYTAAGSPSGSGILYFPPTSGCYRVTAINGTNLSHVRIVGNGARSQIKVTGSSPINHIWWDLTNHDDFIDVSFRDLSIVDDGSTVVSVLFFAAPAAGGIEYISGIDFDHVSIRARTTQAIFYGVNTASAYGYSGFSCRDSTWFELNNGAFNADVGKRNAVLVLDGLNSRNIQSDYVAVTPHKGGDNATTITNCNFTDSAIGFYNSGTRDNNASIIMVTSGGFDMRGGSASCLCDTPIVIRTNCEDVKFSTVTVQATDGTVLVNHFVNIGGGMNGDIAFDQFFWSVPIPGGVFIAIDVPVLVGSTWVGGVDRLRITNPDVGGNLYNNYFIQDINGCGGFPSTNDWLTNSYLETQAGASWIAACGNIDSHTVWKTNDLPRHAVFAGSGADHSIHQ